MLPLRSPNSTPSRSFPGTGPLDPDEYGAAVNQDGLQYLTYHLEQVAGSISGLRRLVGRPSSSLTSRA